MTESNKKAPSEGANKLCNTLLHNVLTYSRGFCNLSVSHNMKQILALNYLNKLKRENIPFFYKKEMANDLNITPHGARLALSGLKDKGLVDYQYFADLKQYVLISVQDCDLAKNIVCCDCLFKDQCQGGKSC